MIKTHKISKPISLVMFILITIAFMSSLPLLAEGLEANPTSEAIPSPAVHVNVKTDRATYLLRQRVVIDGNVTEDGMAVTDFLAIVQTETPREMPVAYRTLTVGNPAGTWPIDLMDLFLLDMANNPINTAETGTQIQVGMTINNWQVTQREIYATTTVFDANYVPLQVGYWAGVIGGQETISPRFSIYIPNSACSGKALIAANVYSQEPKEGGRALTLEKTLYFCISRTQHGLFEYPTLPPPQPQETPGVYNMSIRLPPEPKSGEYTVYVSAQVDMILASTSTTFNVEQSSGYPPQASFAYWPPAPYENMTVEFDASSSTPEGFNDTIIKYEWSFGDGTPNVIKEGNYTHPPNPTVTHKYLQPIRHIITLNVTDNEGLWSTTSKPINIYPEFGPTANFTWTPETPIIDQTVTFDASNTTTGWSKSLGDFSPIKDYTWNFADGTGDLTVSTPLIIHAFTNPGNYTVTLTVTDETNRLNTTWATIQVLNVTVKDYDLNGDGIIDGADIIIVAHAFGSFPGHPRWNPIADINGDNVVDGTDIIFVARHFGEDP